MLKKNNDLTNPTSQARLANISKIGTLLPTQVGVLPVNPSFFLCRCGGIGRHEGLKIPFLRRSAGSIPAAGTIFSLKN